MIGLILTLLSPISIILIITLIVRFSSSKSDENVYLTEKIPEISDYTWIALAIYAAQEKGINPNDIVCRLSLKDKSLYNKDYRSII